MNTCDCKNCKCKPAKQCVYVQQEIIGMVRKIIDEEEQQKLLDDLVKKDHEENVADLDECLSCGAKGCFCYEDEDWDIYNPILDDYK